MPMEVAYLSFHPCKDRGARHFAPPRDRDRSVSKLDSWRRMLCDAAIGYRETWRRLAHCALLWLTKTRFPRAANDWATSEQLIANMLDGKCKQGGY